MNNSRPCAINHKLLILTICFSALLLSSEMIFAQGENQEPFHIKYAGLDLYFTFFEGHLRQTYMLPDKNESINKTKPALLSGLEVALQCTGANRIDQNPTGGSPGNSLVFIKVVQQQTENGQEMIITQKDTLQHLLVESHYEFYKDIPVIRRFTVVENIGSTETGIEFVSSAMVNNIGMQGKKQPDEKLLVHYAQNTWRSEAQWKAEKAKDLGWYYNGEFYAGEVSLSSTGSMTTGSFLPMAAIEDTEMGTTWFWQIEHSGPWYWEMAGAKSTYLYLGGPEEKHHDAWKNLKPGEKYTSAPVAIGCIKGNFDNAVTELTKYRRRALVQPHIADKYCPVIFNDYMNCLDGNPTTAKELPLINVASKVGCEYFVIDAGWYGELNKGWWDEIGAWQPTKSRFPNGITEVMDSIKKRGMLPGLWLEIELAGINSPLKSKPDNWFFQQHGKRVIEGGRYFLDFRNPEVVKYCDSVVDRIVTQYGVQYIKKDYNCSAPFGTDYKAESTGQGMLQHIRANINWVDEIHKRHPNLVIENCSGGGMRTDYMMLSHHQIQSSSDQTNYKKYPSILVGSMAAVLPEQLAVWSYPLKTSDAAEASFNMVSAMLCRIHLSGQLDNLQPAALRQVVTGIEVYKDQIRKYIPQSTPFFPLGMPSITDETSAVALGLKHAEKQFISVWRLAGSGKVSLPVTCKKVSVLYPTDLGITAKSTNKGIDVIFPKTYMAVILEVTPEL